MSINWSDIWDKASNMIIDFPVICACRNTLVLDNSRINISFVNAFKSTNSIFYSCMGVIIDRKPSLLKKLFTLLHSTLVHKLPDQYNEKIILLMRKIFQNFFENVKNMTLFCGTLVLLTILFLLNCNRLKKYRMSQLSLFFM